MVRTRNKRAPRDMYVTCLGRSTDGWMDRLIQVDKQAMEK